MSQAANGIISLTFKTCTIEQGPRSESPVVHLPELAIGTRDSDALEAEKKRDRVVAVQVAQQVGVPFLGTVSVSPTGRGRIIALQLERAQFVELFEAVRAMRAGAGQGSVQLTLTVVDQTQIVKVDIESTVGVAAGSTAQAAE